jgi:hypothetical protein
LPEPVGQAEQSCAHKTDGHADDRRNQKKLDCHPHPEKEAVDIEGIIQDGEIDPVFGAEFTKEFGNGGHGIGPRDEFR